MISDSFSSSWTSTLSACYKHDVENMFVAGVLLFLLACGGAGQTNHDVTKLRTLCKSDTHDERISEAQTVLSDWHKAAANADERTYFSLLHERSIFLGTDATERWTKHEFHAYAKPHFDKGKAWTFVATRRNFIETNSRDILAFDEELKTEGLGPARGSGLLVRKPCGVWQILQYNLTLTIPNEKLASVRDLLGE